MHEPNVLPTNDFLKSRYVEPGRPAKGSDAVLDVDDMSEDDLDDDVHISADPEAADEEMEDMHQREIELQEELNLATVRVSELKMTLQATKSFIEARGGVPPVAKKNGESRALNTKDPRLQAAIPDEEEDEDAFEYDDAEDYEEEEEVSLWSW